MLLPVDTVVREGMSYSRRSLPLLVGEVSGVASGSRDVLNPAGDVEECPLGQTPLDRGAPPV